MTRAPVHGESIEATKPSAPPAPRAPEEAAPAEVAGAADIARAGGPAQAPSQAQAARVVPTAEAVNAAPAQPAAEPPHAAPAQPAAETRHAAPAQPAVAPTQVPRPGPDPTLAGPLRRLVGFAIDAAILTLITGALWGRLLASFANRMSNAVDANSRHTPAAHGAYGRVLLNTTGPYLAELVLTIILAIVYYWLLTGYWGTTIGKRAVGTWVVTADGRSRVSLRRSFVRALVFVLGGEVIPLFFVADNFWLTGDRRRQAVHDKVAGTLVVRTPQRPGAGEDQAGEDHADEVEAGEAIRAGEPAGPS